MSLLFRPVEHRAISHQDMFSRGFDLSADLKSGTSQYSARAAMCLSAVAACVELRANYVAQLPFDSFRDGAGGTAVKVSPQPPVIVRPSARRIPRSLWMKQAQYARLLWGNATLVIGARDAAGYPKSMDVLPPWEVAFKHTSILERLQVTVGGQPFDVDDLIIVPGQVRPGETVGVAPLAASGLVDLGQKAQEFGRSWFQKEGVPSSIIYSDKEMDGPEADSIVQTVLSKWRRNRPAVMGSGLRYEKIGVAANESQFLETIRQNQAEIAIVLGIDPSAIGVSVGPSNTYANREQNAQQVMLNTVNNDLLLWQEVLYDVVPKPQFVRFSTGAFLRSDLKTRYDAYKIGLDAGFLNVNEPRGWEDLPPISDTPAPVEAGTTRSTDLTEEVRSMLTRQSVRPETHIHIHDAQEQRDTVVVPAPTVNVSPAQVTVNVPAAEVVVNVEPSPLTVNVPPAEVVVNVEPPVVNVSNEPAQVTVNVEPPDDSIEIIRFDRDADGKIVGAKKAKG